MKIENTKIYKKEEMIMKWKKLFQSHILERGYHYYLQDAVENLRVYENTLQADVIGTEEYEVEISLNEKEEIKEMYCSCPYAEDGWNCKHMAAVLFEWTEGKKQYEVVESKEDEDILFMRVYSTEAFKKKEEAIQNLIEQADIKVVKSYLTSMLLEDEKSLVRFYNIVKPKEVNVKHYKTQVDGIVNRYLGKSRFISYQQARGFISELEEIYATDVCRMIENEQYMSAFELMSSLYFFIVKLE